MGNITELRQGSLNGLRRQTNECLESAYNKGYEDGKKEGIESHGEQEYNRGIEDASNLLAYADERFIRECFPSESNWNLFDLNAKYGLAVLIKEFEKWQANINQIDGEIKVGDEVYLLDSTNPVLITRVSREGLVGFSKHGRYAWYSYKEIGELHKTGRHFDEIEQVLDKLKGDK